MHRFAPFALASLLVFAAACEDETDRPPGYPGPLDDDEVQVEANADEYADTDPSALTDFRATLDPHGTWVDDPTYGTVWIPNAAEVGADFAPYETSGHWAYDDDDDYVWVSDYDWGWAPFHYGRWVWIDGRGWAWIPGREYAGAWVDWRWGEGEWGYIGWGPLPPYWIWRGGLAVYVGFAPPRRYWFCPRHEIFSGRVAGVIVRPERGALIAPHTAAYVAASPRVGMRVVPHGPPPTALGIDRAAVPRAMASEHGLAMARAYAHPVTARAYGAHAPAAHVVHVPSRGGYHGGGYHGGFHGGGVHMHGGGGHHGGGHR